MDPKRYWLIVIAVFAVVFSMIAIKRDYLFDGSHFQLSNLGEAIKDDNQWILIGRTKTEPRKSRNLCDAVPAAYSSPYPEFHLIPHLRTVEDPCVPDQVSRYIEYNLPMVGTFIFWLVATAGYLVLRRKSK